MIRAGKAAMNRNRFFYYTEGFNSCTKRVKLCWFSQVEKILESEIPHSRQKNSAIFPFLRNLAADLSGDSAHKRTHCIRRLAKLVKNLQLYNYEEKNLRQV